MLKLDAAISRKGSAKGEKDHRDIMRILWVFGNRRGGVHVNLVTPYMTSARVAALKSVVSGPARLGLAGGKSHLVKRIAGVAEKALSQILNAQEH